jgi:uncharacterized membrane protein (DUF4010 family)
MLGKEDAVDLQPGIETELLASLGVALACGLIVGFERGWQQRGEEAAEQRAAGIRTFALAGLAGGVVAALGADPWLLAAGLLALAGLSALSWQRDVRSGGDVGMTTELALLATYLLGALATAGHRLEAVSAAVIVALMLGFKAEIHATLGRLNRREVHASLQLLLIAVVVVPLLPDRGLGPFAALNPRTIGLLGLLVAGIGFVGYFAVRLLGARVGLLFTAAFGGLSASTAVTLGYARLARRRQASTELLGAGILLACAIMGPRLAIEVAVVNPALLPPLLPGLAALTLGPAFGAYRLARGVDAEAGRAVTGHAELLENPLELRQAIGLAALIALVFLLVAAARAWLGDAGVYVLAALSGFVDVDAVTLTLAQQAKGDLEQTTAVRAILLAALVNGLVKGLLALGVGGRRLAAGVLPILAASSGLALVLLCLPWIS